MPLPSTLNPWQERGIPLDQQYRSFKERSHKPFSKCDVEAYTRSRVILMNGVENESWA